MKEKIRVGQVEHVCVVVSDLERTVNQVRSTFDAPLISAEEYASTARVEGRVVGKYKFKNALINLADNLTLEFLQVTEGKSIEQEWLKQHGKTMHHIAIRVEDMEKQAAEWEKMGIEILQEDNGRWIYLNTERILGFNIELLPSNSH